MTVPYAYCVVRVQVSSAARHGRNVNGFTISNNNPRKFTLIHEAARCPGGSMPRTAFILLRPAGVETCQIGGATRQLQSTISRFADLRGNLKQRFNAAKPSDPSFSQDPQFLLALPYGQSMPSGLAVGIHISIQRKMNL
jgi:hypothetical protein